MSVPSTQPRLRPWLSFLLAFPCAFGVPGVCWRLWALAIDANPAWHGGMFYFPTSLAEVICMLVFLVSALPFLFAMVIGLGLFIPLLEYMGLLGQQIALSIPSIISPLRFDLAFFLAGCLASGLQVITWAVVIHRLRHIRESRKQSRPQG